VLASPYPASDHVSKPYKYLSYEHSLNSTSLNFPLSVKDIPKFEILNPFISVNVLSLDDKDFCIEYCRPERNRPHHVNLLLLSQGNKKTLCVHKRHVSSGWQQNKTHKHATFVCNGCLHQFSSKAVLDRHAQNVCVTPHRRWNIQIPKIVPSNFKLTTTIPSSILSRLRLWIFSVSCRRRWRWAL